MSLSSGLGLLVTILPLVLRLLPGVIALFVVAGCAAPNARPLLVVASDLDNPPFAWIDEHGVARGRDVEMMEELATALGALGRHSDRRAG